MKVNPEELARLTYELKKYIKPGCVIYGIRRTPNAISVVVIAQNDLLHPSYGVAAVAGLTLVETKGGYNAIRVGGYGYNKIDHIADAIGYALYGPGHKITGRYI